LHLGLVAAVEQDIDDVVHVAHSDDVFGDVIQAILVSN
jgi:hypothetical protein